MFSGKTEELLRRIKRAQIGRQRVQVFKPEIDNRYSVDHVQSHDANRVASHPVKKAINILELVEDTTRVVGIDEAQFFDEGIVDVAQKLAFRGMRVIVAGLDMDFRGQPFGSMPTLLALAEEVTKLSAICMVCGGTASRSQRIAGAQQASSTPGGSGPSKGAVSASDEQILVGAKDIYEARCRFCHAPGSR
jgi:thymidine kinase